MRLAKFCKVDAWSQALLFTGEASFSSRFFLNIPEMSAQVKKPTKYYSIIFTETILFSQKTAYFSNDSYDSYKNSDGNSKSHMT